MNFKYYKEGQGAIVRWVAGGGLAILALMGCISLYNFIPLYDPATTPPRLTFWGQSLARVPFFGFAINIGMIISFLVFLAVLVAIYLLLVNRPSSADFLIETDIELKKVSWPPKHEYWGSSTAVIVSVLIIGIFLLTVDSLLAYFMRLIKLH